MRHDSLALTLAASALGLGAIGAALSPARIVGPVAPDAHAASAEQDYTPDTGASRFDASLAMAGPNSYPMRYASGSTVTARIDRPSPYDAPFDAGFDARAPQADDAASDQLGAAMADDHAPDDGDGAQVAPDDVGDVTPINPS